MKPQLLVTLLTAAAVTGCAPLAPKECHKTRALDACTYHRSGKVSDKDSYGVQASGIKKRWMLRLHSRTPGTVNDAMCTWILKSMAPCKISLSRAAIKLTVLLWPKRLREPGSPPLPTSMFTT